MRPARRKSILDKGRPLSHSGLEPGRHTRGHERLLIMQVMLGALALRADKIVSASPGFRNESQSICRPSCLSFTNGSDKYLTGACPDSYG